MNVGNKTYIANWGKSLPITALFAANMISLAGSALTSIAIPWFVLQTTGSIVKTGVIAFFTTLPTIIASALGGVLVDRVGGKRISVLADLMAGFGIMLIPLFYHTVGLSFLWLIFLVFLATLLNGPGGTARLALVPDLANIAGMPLERANAIAQGISHIAVLVGAPLAGILIALIGTSNLLWIDALTFGISALIVGMLVPVAKGTAREPVTTGQKEQKEETSRGSNFLAELQESIQFILHDNIIWAILLTFIVTNLLDVALTSVITPVYVKLYFGNPLVLGLISASFIGAALLGTVLYGMIGHRLPRHLTLALSLVFVGLRFWVLAGVPPLPFILFISAVAGIASSPLNPIVFSIAYERIPAEMRGRVLGSGMALAAVGIPLGTLSSGFLINGVGMQTTLLIMGTCYLFTTLAMLINFSPRKHKGRLQEK